LFASGTLSSVSNGDPYTLTDSTKNWSWNRWRGYSIRRPSDGATAVISANGKHTLRILQWRSQSFSVGDKYEIRKVIQALDQPGLGAQVGTMNRNNPRWMQQATEPCYSWNNTDQNNNPVNFLAPNRAPVLEGRDYFNDTPMPGYTPYTYPHPLTTSLSPPQPRAGVKVGSRHHFYKKEKNEAKNARRKKWGHAKENLTNEMAQPDQ
jgi:hypothetical protein